MSYPAKVSLVPGLRPLTHDPRNLTNHSLKKTPNLRPRTPRSPAIRDDFKLFDDVFAVIPVKVDS